MRLTTKDKIIMIAVPILSTVGLYAALAYKHLWWPF